MLFAFCFLLCSSRFVLCAFSFPLSALPLPLFLFHQMIGNYGPLCFSANMRIGLCCSQSDARIPQKSNLIGGRIHCQALSIRSNRVAPTRDHGFILSNGLPFGRKDQGIDWIIEGERVALDWVLFYIIKEHGPDLVFDRPPSDQALLHEGLRIFFLFFTGQKTYGDK